MSSTPASKPAMSGSGRDPKCCPSQVSTVSTTPKSEVCIDDASDSCISDQSHICMLAPSTLQQATQVLSRDSAEPLRREAAQFLSGSSSAQHRLVLPMNNNPASCYGRSDNVVLTDQGHIVGCLSMKGVLHAGLPDAGLPVKRIKAFVLDACIKHKLFQAGRMLATAITLLEEEDMAVLQVCCTSRNKAMFERHGFITTHTIKSRWGFVAENVMIRMSNKPEPNMVDSLRILDGRNPRCLPDIQRCVAQVPALFKIICSQVAVPELCLSA